MTAQSVLDVIGGAMTINTGNEMEPITDVYTPQGFAITIIQRLKDAGFVVVPADLHARNQAVVDRLDGCRQCHEDVRSGDLWFLTPGGLLAHLREPLDTQPDDGAT